MDFDYKLLAKYLIEELSPEEMAEVITWRNSSPENKQLFSELVKLRISRKYMDYNAPDKLHQALNAVNRRIERKTIRYRLRSAIKYAALLILAISCLYGARIYFFPSETYTRIIVKPQEEVRKITLDDGTTVWLKGASSLQIPKSFAENNRQVIIEGEGYFDVKRNTSSPFYVSAGPIKIKVLGTSFNVKASEGKDIVETVLVQGKVALLDNQGKAVMNMSPGEKVTFDSGKNEYSTEYIDVNIPTAWHLNQITFEKQTLREVADRLSSMYHIHINFQDEELTKRKYRIIINQDEPLENVLKQIAYLASVRYRIEGSEIFIYKE